MIGAPTDSELRAELATATAERHADILAELDDREQHRASLRGHDPALCVHPVYCAARR